METAGETTEMIANVGSERILDTITGPCDVKSLGAPELKRLCAEIRSELVSTVSLTGGHLAPNLGVVELTIGIHRALDCPADRIVFDVGHQSYVHKLLTGRLDRFGTLRQYGGLCGFTKRSESPFDSYDAGHASDSLSVGLGLALARDARGGDEAIVVVIGDGSMTGGMSFEALNNIGHLGTRLVIVLNDNEMSISENVGALASYLARVRLDRRYQRLRDGVESRLAVTQLGKGMVDAGEAVKESVKQLLLKPGMIFEELGLKYVGPIDGHDIEQVERAVASAKATDGPVIIHAVTRKGAGYEHAETEPDTFHGIGPFSVETGKVNGSGGPITYTAAFAKALIAEAENDERIVAITAAMPSGTGLNRFAERFPMRFYDVGIAEEHAVGMAAGMAFGGLLPVVAIYSTFMQRAYDQLIIDICLQNLHAVFCLDRAGLVEDGPTHHGMFDLTYLRSVPNLSVIAPSDEVELADALHTALALDGPVAIRYPRGAGTGVTDPGVRTVWEYGRARVLETGEDVAIIAAGRMTGVALEAAEELARQGVSATVVDARWVKPLDREVVSWAARSHRLVVTVEENTEMGGFGSAVCEVLADLGLLVPVLRLAIADCFVTHGAVSTLLADVGLTPDGVSTAILGRLSGLRDAEAPSEARTKARGHGAPAHRRHSG